MAVGTKSLEQKGIGSSSGFPKLTIKWMKTISLCPLAEINSRTLGEKQNITETCKEGRTFWTFKWIQQSTNSYFCFLGNTSDQPTLMNPSIPGIILFYFILSCNMTKRHGRFQNKMKLFEMKNLRDSRLHSTAYCCTIN